MYEKVGYDSSCEQKKERDCKNLKTDAPLNPGKYNLCPNEHKEVLFLFGVYGS